MKNSFIIYGLIISSFFMISTVFIDVKAITTKNIDDTLVLSNLHNAKIHDFIIFTKNNTALTITSSSGNLVISNAVFMGLQKEGHVYASNKSGFPFLQCTYKNIPCYFIIDFKSNDEIQYIIHELSPPPSATPFCDKYHNCADTPEHMRNIIKNE